MLGQGLSAQAGRAAGMYMKGLRSPSPGKGEKVLGHLKVEAGYELLASSQTASLCDHGQSFYISGVTCRLGLLALLLLSQRTGTLSFSPAGQAQRVEQDA